MLINDSINMGPLMASIKAVHSMTPGEGSAESLKMQRLSMETFSRLVTPSIGLQSTHFTVNDIPCEWVSPSFAHRKDRIILYCHGGGYTCGGLRYAKILADKLALHTGLEVISFEYSLAPENPYPCSLNECVQVWDHLLHQGYGASQIIVAGDSAGGNMALELCLSLKKEKRFQPLALVLFSPWTDMEGGSLTYQTCKDKDPLITEEYVHMVREAYAGFEADYTDPAFSPLFADLHDLPPMLIQVGSNEILKSDSEQLAKKVNAAQGNAKLEIYLGGWHVFQQMPFPLAVHAMDSVGKFIQTL